jgi:protein-disulfide isomerase
VYYPLSFLDRQLGNDSSLRAANAAGCAQDAGAFAAYHDTVFANQPAREGDGYTDEELLQFGRDAGIEEDGYAMFETCVQDRTYEGWVQQVQQVANDRPVTGTPTLFLDSELVDTSELITGESFDPEKLRVLVEAAA